jgi:hypothetical protein
MRALLVLAATLLLPLAAAGAQPADAESELARYEFYFRQIGEPPRFDADGTRHFTRRFRLLVLPHGRGPYMVRVDQRGLNARVRALDLDYDHSYQRLRILRQQDYALDRDDLAALNALVRAAELERPLEHNETSQICLGVLYVFQGADERGVWQADRLWCQVDPDTQQLIDAVALLRPRR